MSNAPTNNPGQEPRGEREIDALAAALDMTREDLRENLKAAGFDDRLQSLEERTLEQDIDRAIDTITDELQGEAVAPKDPTQKLESGRLRVSSDDTSPKFHEDKIVDGENADGVTAVEWTTVDGGADETRSAVADTGDSIGIALWVGNCIDFTFVGSVTVTIDSRDWRNRDITAKLYWDEETVSDTYDKIATYDAYVKTDAAGPESIASDDGSQADGWDFFLGDGGKLQLTTTHDTGTTELKYSIKATPTLGACTAEASDCSECTATSTPETIDVTIPDTFAKCLDCMNGNGVDASGSLQVSTFSLAGTHTLSQQIGNPCVWVAEVGSWALTIYTDKKDCAGGGASDTRTGKFTVVLERLANTWFLFVDLTGWDPVTGNPNQGLTGPGYTLIDPWSVSGSVAETADGDCATIGNITLELAAPGACDFTLQAGGVWSARLATGTAECTVSPD